MQDEVSKLVLALILLSLKRLPQNGRDAPARDKEFQQELRTFLKQRGMSPSALLRTRNLSATDRFRNELRALVVGHVASSAIPARTRWRMLVEATVMHEVTSLLSSCRPGEPATARARRKRVLRNQEFMCSRDAVASIMDATDAFSDVNARLGILDPVEVHRMFREQEPLRILVPHAYLAELILFRFLKSSLGIPLDIDFQRITINDYVFGLERNTAKTNYDLCVGTDAAAGRVLSLKGNDKHFVAGLLTARRNRLLATPGTSDTDAPILSGDVSVLVKRWSSAEHTFRRLRKAGFATRASKSVEVAADEGWDYLQSAGANHYLIAWTPFWQIYSLLGAGILANDPMASYHTTEIALFARESTFDSVQDPRLRALRAIINHAWHKLLSQPHELIATLSDICSATQYLETLSIYSGVELLREGAKQ